MGDRPGAGETVLALDRVTKRFGEAAAVDAVSLSVRRGEVFALLGPNGAGKTTTVEILEGYRERTDGEVSVLGRDPARARSRPFAPTW